MSSVDLVLNVQISTSTRAPTQAGFGTPMLLAYHNVFPQLVRSYGNIDEIVDAGFATTSPVYKMAAKIFSQNPNTGIVKVGRRQTAFTKEWRITPKNVTEGQVYSWTVVSPDGTSTPISYTVPGSATVASIVTALQALFNAIAGLTATDDVTHLTLDADNAGEIFFFQGIPDFDFALFEDRTADPGIVADFLACRAEDPDFYMTMIDSNSRAETLALAASIETITGMAAFQTSDSNVEDSGDSTDVMSTARTSGYLRSFWTHSYSSDDYVCAAWAGKVLPETPGDANWAYQILAGVSANAYKSAHFTSIAGNHSGNGKNGNLFTTIKGLNVTYQGITAGGDWIDITRSADLLKARTEEAIFGGLVSNKKIGFTDRGVATMAGLVRGVLALYTSDANTERMLASTPAPNVTAPKVSAVPMADRANRRLPDIAFTAKFAGAINNVTVKGLVSV